MVHCAQASVSPRAQLPGWHAANPQRLTALLVVHKPEEPEDFLIDQLKNVDPKAGVPSIFSEADLDTLQYLAS